MHTRTYANLFDQEILDRIQGDIIRLDMEFQERKDYIEHGLREQGEARLAAFKTFASMVQVRV